MFLQTGTFVADISRKQVEESYVTHIALALESIMRAAPVIETNSLQDLGHIINAHETSVKRARFDETITRDDEFKRYIADVNNLTMLRKTVDVSEVQMDRCRLLSLPSPGAGQETIAQHRAILNALATRDPDASMKALRLHIETSIGSILAYSCRRPKSRLAAHRLTSRFPATVRPMMRCILGARIRKDPRA